MIKLKGIAVTLIIITAWICGAVVAVKEHDSMEMCCPLFLTLFVGMYAAFSDLNKE